jgi:hypothetical protein
MKANYNPSVNILRDSGRDFNYIPTPNGKRVVGQLVDDFKKGIRSFNLIGSYGTGKSSFLLALEQSLKKQKRYYEPNFIANPKFGILKIVGAYESIIDAFAAKLNVTSKQNKAEHVLSELYNLYHDLGKKSPLLFIEIDEFGKFLEYAAQNKPEQELYFVQQLAEFVNNTDYNIVLLTTIHQSFESYAFSLTDAQRMEWSKIKGRFKEIIFNEPVEQLLFLASEHIEARFPEKPQKKVLDASLMLFSTSKAFNYSEAYSKEINEKIYPLDIIAANVLTLALQRYGQNERSLFSFLESSDFTSLEKFNRSSSRFYSLPEVYDYLNFNLYSYLTSHFNPDYSAISIIKNAIEEVERKFDKNIEEHLKLVKTIGLLNIFAASGSTLDKAFLMSYADVCLGIKHADKLIDLLSKQGVIFYRNHSSRYILFEGTDVDIHSALIEVGNRVDEITDVPTLLNRYFDFPQITPNKYSFETGTPRKFQYVISDEPISQTPQGEIDGFINLIFNEKLSTKKIASHSEAQQEAILYCIYKNATKIKSLLRDIQKTTKLIEENSDDKIAIREFEKIRSNYKQLLNHYILDNIYNKEEVTWFWKGKQVVFNKEKELRLFLSRVCHEVYPDTPIYKNELVNKHKISSQIHSSRKVFFKALVNNWSQLDLGFTPNKFPPEKTLYLTLLKENNLATYVDEVNRELRIKKGSSFTPLWKFCNEFLKSAAKEKKNIGELVEALQQRPFKLKQGLIDIWVPSFLFLKREDFALYGEHGFIPEFSGDTLELISKDPQDYWIKSFNIEGIRLDIFNSYRIFLNQETKDSLTNQTFIETIKPFLTFYKGLKEYSKQTKRLSKEALAIRTAIIKAQDPEQTFFEDFPAALGTSLTELQTDPEVFKSYISRLQIAIRELRTSLDNLADRFEQYIQDEIVYEVCEFQTYKHKLQARFSTIKRHLLLPHQTKLLMRIDSMLDDRNAWLSSLAQAIVDRPLEHFRDEDEVLLYDKFKAIVLELDSLTNLSEAHIDETHEDVVGLQFESFVDGIKKSLVRMPKNKTKEVETIKNNLQVRLGKDRTLNIAALTKLLKELLTNE